jgi:hypothetical protein
MNSACVHRMWSILLLGADFLTITHHLVLLSKHVFRQNAPWPSDLELVLLKGYCHGGGSLIYGLLVAIHVKYFLLLSRKSCIVIANILSGRLIYKTIGHILSRSLRNWWILCLTNHKVVSMLCWILLWTSYYLSLIKLSCIVVLSKIPLCVLYTLTWIRNQLILLIMTIEFLNV